MNGSFVLDSSLALTWCFDSEATPSTDELLNRLETGAEAHVSPLWAWEVANVLCLAERKGRHTREACDKKLEMLGKLSIVTDAAAHKQAWAQSLYLARKHRLTVYDSSYLEMAIRLSLPLGSLDTELRTAAKKENVVCVPE